MVAGATTFILALLWFFLSSASLRDATPLLWWLGIGSAAFYVVRTLTQLEALRFIDAAIFFPLYKVIGPALVTVIGVFLLKDVLTSAELIGIILSCVVPLLLITRAEHRRQNNLWFGLLLMLVSTSFAAVTAALNAYAVKPSAELAVPFMAIGYGFGFLFATLWYVQKHKLPQIADVLRNHSTREALTVGVAIGVFQIISFYFMLLAFVGADLSVAYSVNAHYILIPVILSVWFYKEHWNKQKAAALVVSILALVLLHD
jgi:drug/metabolite transporter (DMT)-like permease